MPRASFAARKRARMKAAVPPVQSAEWLAARSAPVSAVRWAPWTACSAFPIAAIAVTAAGSTTATIISTAIGNPCHSGALHGFARSAARATNYDVQLHIGESGDCFALTLIEIPGLVLRTIPE